MHHAFWNSLLRHRALHRCFSLLPTKMESHGGMEVYKCWTRLFVTIGMGDTETLLVKLFMIYLDLVACSIILHVAVDQEIQFGGQEVASRPVFIFLHCRCSIFLFFFQIEN